MNLKMNSMGLDPWQTAWCGERWAIEGMCRRDRNGLSASGIVPLRQLLTAAYQRRDEGFGNSRMVRNLYERVMRAQADRLALLPDPDLATLQALEAADIPEQLEDGPATSVGAPATLSVA
jgi:hypothetical protein